MASKDPIGWGNFNECGNFELWADQPPADFCTAAIAAANRAPTTGVATAGAATTTAATTVKTAYNPGSAATRAELMRFNTMVNLEPAEPPKPYDGKWWQNMGTTWARTTETATQTIDTLADIIRRFPPPKSDERLKKQ